LFFVRIEAIFDPESVDDGAGVLIEACFESGNPPVPAYAVDPGMIAPDWAGRSGAGLQSCRHGPHDAT
jgi:hypothetical protein